MFVGEGPGAEEDASGRPFVGAAGQLLNSLLPLAGLCREEVFIANLVKCRPPGNRVPLPEETAACRPFLVAQIAVIQPQVICTLGSPALKELLDPRYSVTQVHGRLFKLHGMLHYAMFHPAAALYDESRLETLRTDMQRLGAALQRLDAYGVGPPARETSAPTAQPSLFGESAF
jgi:DNA polymerase